jgi:hypothetical protein
VQFEAVKVTFPPTQIVSEDAVITGVCVITSIRTGTEAGLTQPLTVHVAE